MGQYDEIKVSVIVPVYKCEKYIHTCIQSILRQTHNNLEIILVCDGEADNSPSICRTYEAQDSRITVIEQENQGVSVARNNGIKAASGKWIMFVDGDDWIEPNCVEVLLCGAEDSGCDVIVSPVMRDDGRIPTRASFFSPKRSITDEKEKELLIINTVISKDQNSGFGPALPGPYSKLYRREFLTYHSIHFIPGMKIEEDTLFVVSVFWFSSKTTIIEDKLYHYRTNVESTLHSYSPDFRGSMIQYLHEIESLICLTGIQALQEAVNEKTVTLVLDMIKLQFVPAQCNMSRSEKIRSIKRIVENDQAPFRENILRAGSEYLALKHTIARLLLKYRQYWLVFLYCELKCKR